MADTNSNILNQLQEYRIQPPAGAFEKALGAIVLMNEAAAAAEASDAKLLGQLQEYSMEAPAINFKMLVAGKKTVPGKNSFSIISMPVLKAASVLLLIAAGTVVYLTLSHKKDTGLRYAKQEKLNSQPAVDTNNNTSSAIAAKEIEAAKPTAVAANTSSTVAKTNTAAGNIKKHAALAATKNIKGKATKFNKSGSIKWLYNDFFYTLANYKEYNREKLFKKAITDKTIVLNKYSYLSISDKMAEMLQELNIIKYNGKPARKAKKAKKKFKKWSKKDEKYFDKKIGKNPVDIIDLTDFLMNN